MLLQWRNLYSCLTTVFLCLVLARGIVRAESLWTDNEAFLYADHRAHAVGDIITILISERSSASRVGQADNSKNSKTGFDAGIGIFKFLPGTNVGSADSFKAQGSLTNSNSVSGQITAKVVEVKAKGLLVISGTQSIKQNGEEQKIVISGMIREDDISSNNTVLSTNVADAQIKLEGNGPIARKQRQGILTQLFNFLF